MKKRLIIFFSLLPLLFLSTLNCYSFSMNTLYYPHVDITEHWETEIGIINTGSTVVSGGVAGYYANGTVVANVNVTIVAGGRQELNVRDVFEQYDNYQQISYLKFTYSGEARCSGYLKFYQNDKRVAIPAVSLKNSDRIYVSHVASNDYWWTGLSLVNTNVVAKTLNFDFGDGRQETLTLAAGEHRAGTVASLFPSLDFEQIVSAVITNASGIIGLELFGSTATTSNHYLSGILLTDQTSETLYYPHVASDDNWWTGVVAFSPDSLATLTINPYTSTGQSLSSSIRTIAAGDKYIGSAEELNLPEGTAWFKIESSHPISGFELFGQNDGSQLAGYSAVNLSTKQGVFAKADQQGWTGIAFVNTEREAATLTLTALNDNGDVVATTSEQLAGNAKKVNIVEDFFSAADISSATYVRFDSDKYIVGFQLNGSADELRLDALPGIAHGPELVDSDHDGYNTAQGDCDDSNDLIHPGVPEKYDGIDNNCNGLIDEGFISLEWYIDNDGDGFGNVSNSITAVNKPNGYVEDHTDCNDSNRFIHPGANEVADNVDNDCDGSIDEGLPSRTWYLDGDDDGYGNPNISQSAVAQPSGYVTVNSDCDDSDPRINPAATEISDGIDNNCNNVVDEGFILTTWYADTDGDGYGDSATTVDAVLQPANYVATSTDCDDTNANIHPGAVELADGIDNNCDGSIDEGLDPTLWYADNDGDSYGDANDSQLEILQPVGYVANADDCDDTNGSINPSTGEVADGIDNNCNGEIDEGFDPVTWYADTDGDTYGDNNDSQSAILQPAGYVLNNSDCDDTDVNVNPGVLEVDDGIDNNCDGNVDEGFDPVTWYRDDDGDNYGDLSNSISAINQPDGYVLNSSDCDDSDTAINPVAVEVADGIDNNCDGQVDEGIAPTDWYADTDGDTYGDSGDTVSAILQPVGYVANSSDCNDGDAAIHPGVVDIPDDGIDQDCDGHEVVTPVAIATGKLNDTGLIKFGNSSQNSLTVEPLDYPGQDASLGRDAAAVAGSLVKLGAGNAGFDFVKIDSDGTGFVDQSVDYTTAPWVAVLDNTTGLMWEVKTDDDGLHDNKWQYSWFNSTGINDGGDTGIENGGWCYGGVNCDTEGYIAEVNRVGLAGYHDWRLPTREELLSIADAGNYNPAIDSNYFLYTLDQFYWTSDTYAINSDNAWYIHFGSGASNAHVKSSNYWVRLVRSE